MRKFLIAALFTTSLAGIAAGQNPPDKPATASASTDEAAKPKKPKAKHVFTNEDIPQGSRDNGTGSNSSGGSASSASSASGGMTAADASAAASTGKDETPKAKGAKAAKGEPSDEIKAAQAKVEGLKQEEKGISTIIEHIEKLIAQGGEYRRNSMGDGLRRQQSDLADAKKRREAAEQELSDLQAPK